MTAFSKAPHREVRLQPGVIRYRDAGSGPTIVLLHGLLADSRLWDGVADALVDRFRVISPDLPLGSHQIALDADADLSPPALATLIAELLEALDLRDVTLVGNDTGGALCQLVAAHHAQRVGRLVLTPCDAYDNFLPPMFRPLQTAARIPGAVGFIALTLRPGLARRLPMAYGLLSKRRLDIGLVRDFLAPVQRDRRVRRDLTKLLRGIDSRYTVEAAEQLRGFEKPVLLAWAPEDRFFPLRYAQRLAGDLPAARLERIEDSYTFVPVDQPERTAELIADFAAASVPAG